MRLPLGFGFSLENTGSRKPKAVQPFSPIAQPKIAFQKSCTVSNRLVVWYSGGHYQYHSKSLWSHSICRSNISPAKLQARKSRWWPSHDVAYLASFQIELVLYVRSNLGIRFCRPILLSSFHLLFMYQWIVSGWGWLVSPCRSFILSHRKTSSFSCSAFFIPSDGPRIYQMSVRS